MEYLIFFVLILIAFILISLLRAVATIARILQAMPDRSDRNGE